MSDSVWPHRWQPTRLPRPWDSPGKNTGVGCHFLLQCMKVKSESEVTQSCLTLSDPMDWSPPGSSIHGIFHARVPECGAIAFSRGTFSSMIISGPMPIPLSQSSDLFRWAFFVKCLLEEKQCLHCFWNNSHSYVCEWLLILYCVQNFSGILMRGCLLTHVNFSQVKFRIIWQQEMTSLCSMVEVVLGSSRLV